MQTSIFEGAKLLFSDIKSLVFRGHMVEGHLRLHSPQISKKIYKYIPNESLITHIHECMFVFVCM